MNNDNPIGVFDSGLGGISVLKEMIQLMPFENYIYMGDSAFAPYGTKSKDEIIERSKTVCNFLLEHQVKAIVIACNTATSASAKVLRETYPIPIIGMEPALKVAASANNKQTIVIMATAFTLKEKKFQDLLMQHKQNHEVHLIACPELVGLIEHGELEQKDKVNIQLKKYFQGYQHIDSIVLGCTHFVYFKQDLQNMFPQTTIIDGNYGTSLHVEQILKEQHTCNIKQKKGDIKLYNSTYDEKLLKLSYKLLHM